MYDFIFREVINCIIYLRSVASLSGADTFTVAGVGLVERLGNPLFEIMLIFAGEASTVSGFLSGYLIATGLFLALAG